MVRKRFGENIKGDRLGAGVISLSLYRDCGCLTCGCIDILVIFVCYSVVLSLNQLDKFKASVRIADAVINEDFGSDWRAVYVLSPTGMT